MKNTLKDSIKNFFINNKKIIMNYTIAIFSVFIFEMLFIMLLTPYYVTFTKIWSAVAIGSFFATVKLYAGKYMTMLSVVLFVLYMLLYTLSIIGLLSTFDRLPKVLDIFNVAVLFSKYSPFIVIFGMILYLILNVAIGYYSLKSKSINWKRLDAIPPSILAVFIIILQLANKPRILPDGTVWHSYSTYVQANRNVYGRYALAEWGIVNSAFLNESRWKPTYENPFLEPQDLKSDFDGIFAGKNVNLILGESFDFANLNSTATPTLHSMYTGDSIVFNNYYVPVTHHASCRSEATVIGGLFSASAYDCPWLEKNLVDEINKETIFKLFKDKGYDTSYYHSNGGVTYNRRNTIRNLEGVDNALFYGGDNAGMVGGYRDHEFSDNIKMQETNPKFNLWFSYDGHAEYHTDITEKPDLYNDLFALHDNEILAKHGYRLNYFDEGVKNLIDKAGPDDVFIVIADHPLYTDKKAIYDRFPERDGNEFYNVPFFIYQQGLTRVENNNSAISISVKTILNDLFGLDAKRLMGTNPLKNNIAAVNFPEGDFVVGGVKNEKASIDWDTRHTWHEFAYERSKYEFLEWI